MNKKVKTLSGADTLQLLLEHHMTKNGGGTNVIRLEIELKEPISEEEVKSQLKHNESVRFLSRIRLGRLKWFRIPRWELTPEAESISVKTAYIDGNTIPHEIMNESIDIQKEAGFKIWLIHKNNNRFSILFSFHHALFDNRSVCALIKAITTNETSADFFAVEKGLQLKPAVKGLLKIAKFSYTYATKEMGTFCVSSKNANRKTRVINFSEAESSKIKANFHNGSSISFSAAYLAALTGNALAPILEQKDPDYKFMWVPTPVDLKPKGSEEYLFGNKISFLYFKMHKEDLHSVSKLFERNISQMKYQIKQRLPFDQNTFLSVYKRVPMPLYYWMFKGPSRGKLLSYTLSYLGEPFKDLKRIFGKEVLDTINYATSPSPPGISFVFAESKGRLKLSINFDKKVISENEIDEFLNTIYNSINPEKSTSKNYTLHK